MLDLSKSCMKCSHLGRDDKRELKCGITNIPVRFEYSCELFEKNTEMEESVNEAGSRIQFNYARNYKRIGNYFIDVLAVSAVGIIIEVFVVKFYGMDSGFYSSFFKDTIGRLFFVAILNMIYYTSFESITGKTLGKYFTKTKVVDSEGKKPVWSTILLRSLCRLIPLDQISFLFDFQSGWHDTLSKTIVVEDNRVVVSGRI